MQEVLLERFQPLSVGRGQREDLLEARPTDLPRQDILKLYVVTVETIPDINMKRKPLDSGGGGGKQSLVICFSIVLSKFRYQPSLSFSMAHLFMLFLADLAG